MSADRYLSIFSRQIEVIVCIFSRQIEAIVRSPSPSLLLLFIYVYVYISGAVYGTGVYFARDASYSLDYTGGDRKVIYFARVLVGRYCEGRSKFKKPPPINSEQPEILFDSMVNDMKIPSIFVTYYDNQCYPEYLIAF